MVVVSMTIETMFTLQLLICAGDNETRGNTKILVPGGSRSLVLWVRHVLREKQEKDPSRCWSGWFKGRLPVQGRCLCKGTFYTRVPGLGLLLATDFLRGVSSDKLETIHWNERDYSQEILTVDITGPEQSSALSFEQGKTLTGLVFFLDMFLRIVCLLIKSKNIVSEVLLKRTAFDTYS